MQKLKFLSLLFLIYFFIRTTLLFYIPLTSFVIFLSGKDIHILSTHWGHIIPVTLKANQTIPRRQSDTFDFYGTDIVGIRIQDWNHSIEVEKEFGYLPDEVECCVEVGVSHNDINFIYPIKKEGFQKFLNCQRSCLKKIMNLIWSVLL